MNTMRRWAESRELRVALATAVALAGFGLGQWQVEAVRRADIVDTWRIGLGAFPDRVGVGGYACAGCDRSFTGADDMAATDMPLQPLHVIVHKLGDSRTVYWQGLLRRDTGGNQALTEMVAVTAPPPYQVTLLTVKPLGYSLCPNARATVVLRQRDFDADSNATPGSGRNARAGWYFWSCRAPGRD